MSASPLNLFKIDLNLLPKAHFQDQKKISTIWLINKLSIGLLVVLVFLTGAVLSLRTIQRFELQKESQVVKEAEAKVSTFQDKEGQLIFLKQRLDTINNLLNGDIKRKALFSLLIFLTPDDISYSDISIGRDGSTIVSASSPTLQSIDTLLNNLSNKEKNAGAISKIDLDGLTLGKDSIYRFSIKLLPK